MDVRGMKQAENRGFCIMYFVNYIGHLALLERRYHGDYDGLDMYFMF
jgi:hypothetical protein